MTTVASGSSSTLTLDAFGYITVLANGDASLTGVSRAANLKSNVYVSKLASVQYGPYGVPMDVTIACTDGSITYTHIEGYTADAATVIIDDAGGYFAGDTVEEALQELGASGANSEALDQLETAYASQFATVQSGLAISNTINVSATGVAYTGACVLVRIKCIATGTAGTLEVYDDTNAATAANQIIDIPYTDLTAGQYYYAVMPGREYGALVSTGLYVTCTTSGVFAIDIVDDAVAGVLSSGTLATGIYVAAGGILLDGNGSGGPWNVVSIKVMEPGSSGNLVVYADTSAVAANQRDVSYAYTALSPNDIIDVGGYFSNMYLTVPTGFRGIVYVMPR